MSHLVSRPKRESEVAVGGRMPQAKTATEPALDDYEGYEVIAWRMRVILPTTWFRVLWDWILIGLVLYNLVSIPLEICLLVGKAIPPGVRALNIMVDAFFIFDLGLNFRTAYYEGAGLSPVIEPKLIADHYLFGPTKRGVGWFWPDLLAAIPFDWIPSQSLEAVEALSIAKLGRLFRLGRFIKKMDQFTAARAIRVVNLLILVLLCTHFFACIWWKVGWDTPGMQGWQFDVKTASVLLESDITEQPSSATGMDFFYEDEAFNRTQLRERLDEVSIAKKYITSLYWALTMVMKSPWLAPSFGNEQVFACITVVLGAMLFAAFIGNLTTAIASYDKSNALYRDSVGTLRLFFRMRPHMDDTTRRRAFRYAEAYFRQTIEGISETTVISSLPEHMRPSVLLELHQELIKSCSWLQETSFACCCDFLHALKSEILLRGDTLLRAGVVSRCFYILLSGELKVSFPPDGAKVSKLGSILGEGNTAILKASSHQRTSTRVPQGRIERIGSLIGWGPPHGVARPLAYSVEAHRDSSLVSITRVRLAEIIEEHPSEAPTFMRACEHATRLINPIKRSLDQENAPAQQGRLHAGRRCSVNEIMRQTGTQAEQRNTRATKGRATTAATGLDDENAMTAARDEGWLKAGVAGWLRPGAPKAGTPSAASADSFLNGKTHTEAVKQFGTMSTDEKLTVVLQELISVKQAFAEQVAINSEMRDMMLVRTNGELAA